MNLWYRLERALVGSGIAELQPQITLCRPSHYTLVHGPHMLVWKQRLGCEWSASYSVKPFSPPLSTSPNLARAALLSSFFMDLIFPKFPLIKDSDVKIKMLILQIR